MEQIIFATFSIKLKEKRENVKLSYFNQGEDFLDYIQSFFEEINSGDIKTEDFKGKKKFHLRMDLAGHRSEPDRCYYGLISSGVSGDTYKIINLQTNEKKADVNSGDGAFKDVFFFFYIPDNKETGYLILQRKGNFGVKIALENSFRKYLKSKELKGFTFRLYNLISGQVYDRMMQNGFLKKVELIKSKIPASIEDYMKNAQEPDSIQGKMTTTISHKEFLPPRWKRFLNKIYKNRKNRDKGNEWYEAEGIDFQFDEVEFQLEYNGKRKTFHVMNQWKTQPDIDVTLEYKENFGEEITTHQLALLAKSTINDIFNMEQNINE